MKISKLFGRGRPVFSFEFFPPRSDAGYTSLFRTIAELKELTPGFVSVTWGAGGSTRRKTVELVERIQGEIGLTAMAHLTCVGSSRSELGETLDRLEAAGIENVLALGGDRPDGYTPPQDALSYASELAGFIRSRWSFCLGGACYPETHPRAVSREDDLRRLGEKVAAGIDFLITQLFFDNRDYFAFVDSARQLGITAPIVPGVMPVVSAASVRRMAELSGARIPPELSAQLDAAGEDAERTLEIGVRWATRQCRDLLAQGAPGIHFYTLNRSSATRDICSAL
jgi:methylenetetrahydrofolate reductase (NADPH)